MAARRSPGGDILYIVALVLLTILFKEVGIVVTFYILIGLFIFFIIAKTLASYVDHE